jgi:RHS repeat-associated protein
MGCRKLSYYERETAIGENCKIFELGIEKTASGSKICKDYYAGGFQMPGRTANSSQYRYGFGGNEKDDEISGSGNHLSFGDMGYDPRIVRRWNKDPIVKNHESPYAVFANNPIWFGDPSGLDSLIMNRYSIGVQKLDDNNRLETSYVETFLVTFSIVRDGVEMSQGMVMYMGGNAESVRVPDNKTVLLSYDRLMKNHPDWKNQSIHIDYEYTRTDGTKGNNKFIHPENNPIFNIGCLTCSESEPGLVTDEDGYTDLIFDDTKGALISIRKLYEEANGGADGSNLTGDKFLLKTESTARNSSIKKAQSKRITSIQL